MKKIDQDIIIGIIILLFIPVLWLQIGKISGNGAIFPTIVLSLMTVSGFGIIFRAVVVMKKTGAPYIRMNLKEFLWEAGIPGGLLIINALFLRIFGFYICSFLLIIAICAVQGYLINGMSRLSLKSVVKILLYAILSTVFMYICFEVLLSLPTPEGVFGV